MVRCFSCGAQFLLPAWLVMLCHPRRALEFEFQVQASLLLVCLQAYLGGESPADAEGIRREGYPAPHPKAGNRICVGPQF